MATAELAVAVPALLLVLAVGLSAVSLGVDRVRAVDAAHLGARLLARGETEGTVRRATLDAAPDGSRVSVRSEGTDVLVTVSVPVPSLLRRIGVPDLPAAGAAAWREGTPR